MARGFQQALANAIEDIRQKVVEEPWFGRAVTDTPYTQERTQAPTREMSDDMPGMALHYTQVQPSRIPEPSKTSYQAYLAQQGMGRDMYGEQQEQSPHHQQDQPPDHDIDR